MDTKRPIFLSFLRIEGLFGIFNYDISFDKNKKISVLIGPNGSGKSTILSLLNDFCTYWISGSIPPGGLYRSGSLFHSLLIKVDFEDSSAFCSYHFYDWDTNKRKLSITNSSGVVADFIFSKNLRLLFPKPRSRNNGRLKKINPRFRSGLATSIDFSEKCSCLFGGFDSTPTISTDFDDASRVVGHSANVAFVGTMVKGRIPGDRARVLSDSFNERTSGSVYAKAISDEVTICNRDLLDFQTLFADFCRKNPFNKDTVYDACVFYYLFMPFSSPFDGIDLLDCAKRLEQLLELGIKDGEIWSENIAFLHEMIRTLRNPVWIDYWMRQKKFVSSKTKNDFYGDLIEISNYSKQKWLERIKDLPDEFIDKTKAIATFIHLWYEQDFMKSFRFPRKNSVGELAITFSRAPDLLENVRIISKIESSMNDFFQTIIPHQMSFDRSKGFVFTNSELHQRLVLSQLSSGEKCVLSMFFRLFVNDMYARPTIAFIDEPEVSLHVSWQQNLLPAFLRLIQEEDLQILIATHSPFVLSGDETCLIKMTRTRELER